MPVQFMKRPPSLGELLGDVLQSTAKVGASVGDVLGERKRKAEESRAQQERMREQQLAAAQKEEREERKLGLQAEEKRKKEISESFKLYKNERKEILDEAKKSKDMVQKLNKLEKLGDKGNLNSPGWVNFLNGFGDTFGVKNFRKVMLTPDSQEYEQLISDFISGAKQMFGARVTEGEVRLFLKRLPTLDFDKKARKSIISDMKNFYKSVESRKDGMMDIIKESRSKDIPLPVDFLEAVDRKSQDLIDKYADKISFVKPKSEVVEEETTDEVELIRSKRTGEYFMRDKRTGERSVVAPDQLAQFGIGGEAAEAPQGAPPAPTPQYSLPPNVLQNLLSASGPVV